MQLKLLCPRRSRFAPKPNWRLELKAETSKLTGGGVCKRTGIWIKLKWFQALCQENAQSCCRKTYKWYVFGRTNWVSVTHLFFNECNKKVDVNPLPA